jgi:hypothetical protein
VFFLPFLPGWPPGAPEVWCHNRTRYITGGQYGILRNAWHLPARCGTPQPVLGWGCTVERFRNFHNNNNNFFESKIKFHKKTIITLFE